MILLGTSAKQKNVDECDWPRCARCDTPVEDFEVTDTGTSIAFVARCHGEEEVVEIPDSFWVEAETGSFVEIGPVFKPKGEPDV